MRCLRVAVRIAAGWTLVVGVLVLVGWGLRLPALSQPTPLLAPMKPLTAVGFTMSGTALLLLAPVQAGTIRRRAGQLLGLAVAVLNAAVLTEYVTGHLLWIDNLFLAALPHYPSAGRPAPHTALTMLAAGLTLALLDIDQRGGYRPATALTAASVVLALGASLSYLYGVPYLRGAGPNSAPIAPHTALTLLVLAIGILIARPDRPLLRAYNSIGRRGRLSPAVLLLSILISLLSPLGTLAAGLTSPALTVTITTAASVAILLLVVSATVRGLDRAHAAQQESVAALREEQDFTAALLSWMQEGVVVFEADWQVRDANPRWCEMYGGTREQLVGCRPPYPWWPADQYTEMAELLTQTAVTPLPTSEYLMRRTDGSPLWVLGSLAAVRDSHGTVRAYVAVCSDVTRMKLADTKFRALLESAPDATVCVDPSGAITMINSRAEHLFGYPRASLLGQHAEILVAEWDRGHHPELQSNWLADPNFQPQTESLELICRRHDGTEFPAEISLAAIDTDDGVLVSGAIRDVTERKRNEDALRFQQEQTAAIIATATDPFVSIDQNDLVTEWNASAEKVFGWSREEIVGRPLTDTIIPPESAEAHRLGLRRVVEGGSSYLLNNRIEVTARGRDGHQIPIELSVWQGISQEGKQFHAFIHDITERLHLQTEREHAQALAQREEYERRLHQAKRLESLGQLAGGVAHDFNNLLAVIVNYLDFVAEEVGVAGRDEPDRWKATQEDIAQIQRATERAIRLTRQLLTLGRRNIAQPQVINLNELVADVQEFLRRTIGEHVELVTRQSPDLWPVVVDPGQIEQVLVNLAVNARDAMPGGGTLSIDTANVTADEQYTAGHPGHPAGRFVRLRVSDTGSGMPQDVVDRAFEPFFTTKPDGAGTGLGLATVYGILTQAGGHATIYSEPGLGTTVNALLPATDRDLTPESGQLALAVPAALSAAGRTVLLVEDEDPLREVTRRILIRNGFRVIAASNGTEAIQLAEQETDEIDLLLTDVVMPNMFGKAVASEIRARRPAVRVLFMSGYAQPVLASQGTLEPGVALLEKPFSEDALLCRIREVLDGNGH